MNRRKGVGPVGDPKTSPNTVLKRALLTESYEGTQRFLFSDSVASLQVHSSGKDFAWNLNSLPQNALACFVEVEGLEVNPLPEGA